MERRDDSTGSRPSADTLRAVGITRDYAGVRALDDVTLELERHRVHGLIGPNGAGKTTLVNIMSGFDQPDSGSVILGESNITSWKPHRRGRNGLARTFQGAHAFSELSVRENVEVSALGSGANADEARSRADELLDLLGLLEMQAAPAAVLPHGHERALGVARALAISPRFVLMDEPAAGLNEIEVDDFSDVIRLVRDERDVGILLIDHNITLIMQVCDTIHVLDQGQTIAEGTPEEVRDDVDVTTAYLGGVANDGMEAE